MKLFLVRHGQTVENEKGLVQGHLPGALSEKGKKQAKKLALRLKGKKIDAIYSSDLARALDTAKEIANYHKVKVRTAKELRERDMGKLVGKKMARVDLARMPEHVETRKSMRLRAKKFLEKVYKKHPKGNVLFVGHAGINKALMTVILGRPAAYMGKIGYPKNTALSLFEIRAKKENLVHLIGCTKHLE
jgi:probable phosphoglycerate mutase